MSKALTLDNIPVIKELVEDTIDASTQILPPNVKVVYCDGDHDELKIQAAIEAIKDTGGVVYPVGECVLTMDNLVPAAEENIKIGNIVAFGTGGSRVQQASVRLYEGVVIDGRFCKNMTLSLPEAVVKFNVKTFFAIPNGGTIQNVDITMDCASETIAKKAPYTLMGVQANISNCKFNKIYHQANGALNVLSFCAIALDNSNIQNCYIDTITWKCNSIAYHLYITNSTIRDTEFHSMPISPATNGSHMGKYYISGNISNIKFNQVTLSELSITANNNAEGIMISDSIVNNSLVLTGVNNAYLQNIQSKLLGLSGVNNITGDDLKLTCQINIADRCNNIKLSDVYFSDGLPEAACFFGGDADLTALTNSSIFISPRQEIITNFPLAELYIDTKYRYIIKNNRTNLLSIIATETPEKSIIKDNMTAIAKLVGEVTLSSNNEDGFVEGATITATATDGDIEGANISQAGNYSYLWQKSNDTITWEDVGVKGSHTLTGDEKYIRCGVFDSYNDYFGTVYSDAYAVTNIPKLTFATTAITGTTVTINSTTATSGTVLTAGDVIKITPTDGTISAVDSTPEGAFTAENNWTYTVPETPVDVTITAVTVETESE